MRILCILDFYAKAGNTKGGSITVLLTCLTGLDQCVLQIKTKNASCHTADSKPVKQEVNRIVIHPPLVFPGKMLTSAEGCWAIDGIIDGIRQDVNFERRSTIQKKIETGDFQCNETLILSLSLYDSHKVVQPPLLINTPVLYLKEFIVI